MSEAEETQFLLRSFREELTEISHILKIPGSPELIGPDGMAAQVRALRVALFKNVKTAVNQMDLFAMARDRDYEAGRTSTMRRFNIIIDELILDAVG